MKSYFLAKTVRKNEITMKQLIDKIQQLYVPMPAYCNKCDLKALQLELEDYNIGKNRCDLSRDID